MKNLLVLAFLLTTFGVNGAEFKVLQYAADKELAAFELTDASASEYKIGQEVTLKSDNGETCLFNITKIVPEKSRLFMNTLNCNHKSILVKNNVLKTNVEEGSFALANEEKAQDKSLPTINESWYTYWGLGVAKIKYPTETDESLDSFEAAGADKTTIALDLFGFYWPLQSKQTMLGFIVNTVSDTYEMNGVELAVRQYTYSFSTMTFFGPNIGSEWFLRGDIGVAKYQLEVTGLGATVEESSKSGLGVLVGGGYAWAIGTETRLLLNLNYANRNVKSEKVSTTALTLGVLF